MARKIKKRDPQWLKGQVALLERFKELKLRCDEQDAAGDLEGQIETMREWFRISPTPETRSGSARSLWTRLKMAGRPDDDIETWEVMQADDGREADFGTLLDLGLAHLKHENYQRALGFFQRAHRLAPDERVIEWSEILCLWCLRSYAAVRRRLATYLERHPERNEARSLALQAAIEVEAYAEAAAHARLLRFEELSADTVARYRFCAALAFAHTDCWREVLEQIDPVPEDSEEARAAVRELRIEAYARLGRRERFEAERAGVPPTADSDPSDLFGLARGWIALGEPERAVEDLRTGFPESRPWTDEKPRIRLNYLTVMSRALGLAGRAAELRELMTEFDRLCGREMIPQQQLAWSMLLGLEGRWEDALPYARRACYLAFDDAGRKDAEAQLALCEREIALRESRRWAEEGPALQREVEALRRESEELRRRMQQMTPSVRQAPVVSESPSPARDTPAGPSAAREGAGPPAPQVAEEKSHRSRVARARAAIRDAFGPADGVLPDDVRRMLVEAESAYLVAGDVGFAASAVAGLFSSALEEALFRCVVERFDIRLSDDDRRTLLAGGRILGAAAGQVPYRIRFLAYLDTSRRERKAPGIGEIAIALDDRRRPDMTPFRRFLDESFPDSDAFWTAVVSFLGRTKERYRDAVRHRDTLSLRLEDVRPYREALLLRLAQGYGGLLPELYARGYVR